MEEVLFVDGGVLCVGSSAGAAKERKWWWPGEDIENRDEKSLLEVLYIK